MSTNRCVSKLFIALALIAVSDAIVTQKPSLTRLYASDPTALFNADILRIASRTTTKQSNFNPIHAADHADRMLVQMMDMYEKSERKTARPNTETFRIVLKGFANLGSVDLQDDDSDSKRMDKVCAVDRMETIMVRLHDFTIDQDGEVGSLKLNTDVLNLILKAYARCGYQQIPHQSLNRDTEINAQLPWLQSQSERGSYAERAEQLLKYMQQHEISEPSMAPNAQSYAFTVEAWCRQQLSSKKYMSERRKDGIHMNDICVSRASKWLPELESQYKLEVGADDSIIGNRRRNARRILLWAYSDALDAWARSGVKAAAKRANDCMKRIEELSVEDVNDVQRIKDEPNTEIEQDTNDDENQEFRYNQVYSQPNMQLFDEKDVFLHPECPLYPSDQSYTSAILALSRSRESGAARRAHQLLNQMLTIYDSGEWIKNRPKLLAFNSVISAYANSPDPGSADKAEGVLNQLERMYFDKEKPQYNYLKPDVVSYNAAVTAWSNSKEEAAVYKAENIVKRMEEHYDAVGDNFLPVQPDAYTFNALINGWIRSDLGVTSADNADSILRLVIEKFDDGDTRFVPNQRTFCQVINAWTRCARGDELPVKRAMDLLKLMEEMYSEGVDGLKPDMITYSSLIDTISRSRLPRGSDMAMELLEKMEKMYSNGDTAMKPNVRSYSCALSSLVHSQRADKHIIARDVLLRMNKLRVDPNAFTYNYVINCSASLGQGDDESKMEAFKVALNAFTSLRKSSHETDSFTYTFFLKACSSLLQPSTKRSKIVEEAFRECCKEGKVNNEVLSRLTGCLEPTEARSLLSCNKANIRSISVRDLNPRWSCNTFGKR